MQITVKNGTKYEGVFHGAIAEGELGTVLKLSRKLGGNVEGKSNPNPLITSQIIYAKDLMEINVVGVDFTTIEKAYGERDSKYGALAMLDFFPSVVGLLGKRGVTCLQRKCMDYVFD